VAWGTVDENGKWVLATETLSDKSPDVEKAITYRSYLESLHPDVKGGEESKNQENK